MRGQVIPFFILIVIFFNVIIINYDFFNTGTRISVSEVDVFWTRLDYMPEEVEEEECHLQREMDKVTEQLKSQPPQVKKKYIIKNNGGGKSKYD